jgi:mRNA interferase MazF
VGGLIRQGDVWWADLPEPAASEPGFRRPVVVLQSDPFNDSLLETVVVVPLTSNLAFATQPGTVRLDARASGLSRDALARVDQVHTTTKSLLRARAGRVTATALTELSAALDLVLGR